MKLNNLFCFQYTISCVPAVVASLFRMNEWMNEWMNELIELIWSWTISYCAQCCDGNCPPCTLTCGKTLGCHQHKCCSTCHRGNIWNSRILNCTIVFFYVRMTDILVQVQLTTSNFIRLEIHLQLSCTVDSISSYLQCFRWHTKCHQLCFYYYYYNVHVCVCFQVFPFSVMDLSFSSPHVRRAHIIMFHFASCTYIILCSLFQVHAIRVH